MAVALLLGIGAAAAVRGPLISSHVIDRAAAGLGFAVKRIEVRGNRHTRQVDVIAAAAIAPDTTWLGFDAAAVAKRIEALPWVLRARIHREHPDGIVVEIVERRAAILWRQTEKDILVDMTGRELAVLPPGSDVGLPIVGGEHAGTAAPDLLLLLEQSPETARRVVIARRIEARRWMLQLKGGAQAHLPSEGLAGALAWLESQASAGLLDLPLEAIDLRVPGQLVVRPRRLSAAGGPR